MPEEIYRIEIPVEAVDKTGPGLSQAQTRVTAFERSMERTERQLQKMNRTRWQMILYAIDKASPVVIRAGALAREVTSRAYTFTLRAVDRVTGPLRMLGGMATSTLGLLGAGAGVAGAILWPVKLADEMTTANIGFETMLKNADKAKALMNDIREFAIATPFKQREVVEQGRMLLTRGFKPEDVIPTLQTIGDATAALGTGMVGMQRISLALGQIQNKGKLQAEEMLQLTEANIPAWRYLAEYLGTSIANVQKLSEKGKISSEVAVRAILHGMKEFQGMMDKTANMTASGLLAQITDIFEINIFARWGQGLQQGILPGLERLLKLLTDSKGKLTSWGDAVEAAGKKLSGAFLNKIDAVQEFFKNLTESGKWQGAKDIGEKITILMDSAVVAIDKWLSGPGGQKFEAVVMRIVEVVAKAWWAAIGKLIKESVKQTTEGDVLGGAALFSVANLLSGGAIGASGLALIKYLWGKWKGRGAVKAGGATAAEVGARIPIFGPTGEILSTVPRTAAEIAGAGMAAKTAGGIMSKVPWLARIGSIFTGPVGLALLGLTMIPSAWELAQYAKSTKLSENADINRPETWSTGVPPKLITINVLTQPQYQISASADPEQILNIIKKNNVEIGNELGDSLGRALEESFLGLALP